jgi:Fic family protein
VVYSPHTTRRIDVYLPLRYLATLYVAACPTRTLTRSRRHQQGRVLGHMEALGFSLQAEALLQNLTLEVLKSSEIEGELLPTEQVRSSLARRLGIPIAGLVPAERRVEGVVEMLLDATQGFEREVTAERLGNWQAALFPTGRSGLQRI